MTTTTWCGVRMIDRETGIDDDWEIFLDWLSDNEGDFHEEFISECPIDYEQFVCEQYESIEPIKPSCSYAEDLKWHERAMAWAEKHNNTLIPQYIDQNWDVFREWVFRNHWAE